MTKMTFDPSQKRRYLEELHITMAERDDLASALHDRALAGTADSILETSIYCYLVGLHEDGKRLLPKACEFFQAAIEHNEIPRYYFPGATEASRLEQLAIAKWLMSCMHDLEGLKQAVQFREQRFSQLRQNYKSEVQYYLAAYLDAEQYEPLIHRFEAAGLTGPKKLRAIQGEGTMSYVIARHRMGLEYSSEEITDALESFLKRKIPEWLDENAPETTARWMKIAVWKRGDDQIATLLKCYDYLPELERPKYP